MRARGRPRRILLHLLLPLAAATAPAQTPVTEVDVESLNVFSFDATVSCARADGVYVSGSFEGCPTGRAPISGECGLDHVCPDPISVPDAVAAADHYWAQIYQLPLVLDLGQPTDSVYVFNAADHGPFPEESVEWTVWGADGPDVTGFPAGWSLGQLCAIFKQGWVESGNCPGDDSDDYTGLYAFDRPYRYVAVYANYSITIWSDRAHTAWASQGDDDAGRPGWQSSEAELDAVSRPTGPRPTASAGPDQRTCLDREVRIDATGSAGAFAYRWDTDGDGVVDAAGPSVSVGFTGLGPHTPRLFAVGDCGCSTDDVTVIVEECPLLVRYASFAARRPAPGAAVAVSWTTLEEQDTAAFVVERAAYPSGPFSAVGQPVPALGAGALYELADPSAPAAAWYRVVELGGAGRGDATPPFPIELPAGASGHGAPAGGRQRGWR